MVNLKNEFLNLTISKKGAEIVKATNSDGKDIIWIGDKKFWQDHSPVLFPVCGSLLNDKYSYNGTAYSANQIYLFPLPLSSISGNHLFLSHRIYQNL